MTYFAVDDVDAAVARVEQSKGSIQMAPRDIPGVGRFSVIADPQGAVSTLIALEKPPE
jgi:hypothetical protein